MEILKKIFHRWLYGKFYEDERVVVHLEQGDELDIVLKCLSGPPNCSNYYDLEEYGMVPEQALSKIESS